MVSVSIDGKLDVRGSGEIVGGSERGETGDDEEAGASESGQGNDVDDGKGGPAMTYIRALWL